MIGLFGENWVFGLEIFTGLLLVAVSAVLGVVWGRQNRAEEQHDELSAALDEKITTLGTKLDVEINAQARRTDAADLRLAEYKTYVAQTFPTTNELERVDSRIEKLFDRIDAKLDRIESKVDGKVDK